MKYGAPTPLLVGLSVCALASGTALGAAYNVGDVFAAVGHGQVRHFSPTGTLIETLDTTTGLTTTAGMCFDAAGNLYVTTFDGNSVSKFNNSGGLVSANYISGLNSDPESCVFDATGNIYIGTADGNKDILKYDSAGTFVTAFNVAVQSRGADWIDLAADQCTMFYTSEGTLIKRFNVCTNTQLADFATVSGPIFAFRILPGGGILVAETGQVQMLNSSGTPTATYTGTGGTFLFALNRDPNGTQFWTGDIINGNVYKFDIGTAGNQAPLFNAAAITNLSGLAVFGELVVSLPTPTPTGTVVGPTSTPTITATPTPTITATPTPTITPTAVGIPPTATPTITPAPAAAGIPTLGLSMLALLCAALAGVALLLMRR